MSFETGPLPGWPQGSLLCTEWEGWRLEVREANGKTASPPGDIEVVLINPEGREVAVNASIIMHFQNFAEGTELAEAVVRARETEVLLEGVEKELKALRKEHGILKRKYEAELAGWEGMPLLHKAHLERVS